jgi:hypothetical protein
MLLAEGVNWGVIVRFCNWIRAGATGDFRCEVPAALAMSENGDP